MKKNSHAFMAICLFISFLIPEGICEERKPVAWWPFDGKVVDSVHENISGVDDQINGNFRIVPGISGQAIKFDGYTTVVTREASQAPALDSAFTIEAWLAIAAYPWNWCPVVSHSDNNAGYVLEIGPDGELAMKVFSGSTWRTCISKKKISLKSWTHVAGVFDPEKGLAVFIDGRENGRLEFQGRMNRPRRTDLIIGSIPHPIKPSYIHREFGTIPGWYSLDAILDEVKIHNQSLDVEDLTESYTSKKTSDPPDIP